MSIATRSIPGGWAERVVTVRGRVFPLLLPAQPEEVLFQFDESASESGGGDPFWAQLWPTSVQLAEAILDAEWPADAKAIELGCGVGLASLAALSKGLHVTLSDYNPLAVELAVENAQRCGFTNVASLVLDWRSPPAQKFDVILASDVVYDRQLHGPLIHTIETLAHAHSTVWISDRGRMSLEDFFYLAAERWEIKLLDSAEKPADSLPLGEYRRMVCRCRVHER
jgi:predicted nicotinamide N-methyase